MKSSAAALRGVIVFAFFCFVSLKANAAYDAFLNIPGIPGESTAGGHTNEIVVLGYSLSVTNSGTASSFSGLTVTKLLDKASPLLILDCAQGAAITQVTLTLRDQTAAQVEFYKITLHNVFITAVKNSGTTSDARPTETVTFSFQKIDWQYQAVDASGNPVGTPIQTTFTLSGPA